MDIKKTLKQIKAAVEANDIKNDALADQFETAYNDWCDHDASVKQYGVVIPDSKGALKANPSCSHKSNAWGRMQRILEQCGLTPKAKKANGPKQDIDEDPFAGLEPL